MSMHIVRRFARASFAAVAPLAVAASLAVAAPVAVAAPAATTPYILVDQFGYLPAMRKLAVIADPQVGFNAADAFAPGTGNGQYQVRRWNDDAVVMSGTLVPWNGGATHAQSGDRGWRFDFSSVTAPGSYYVWDSARSVGSGRFDIGDGAYDTALRAAQRVFFYQRLGFSKQAPYADPRWTDGVAYEGPGQDTEARSRWAKTDATTARDLRGGWMDAGDTNKYTTFAHEAVVPLLDAYRSNPAVFGDDLGIPESGNGVPDLLDEVRWELDFLTRMQDASGTGGLLQKLGTDNFNGTASPPSSDARPRYYVPECTSATLSGASMFAAAAATYRTLPSQQAFATQMLQRAEQAWTRAKATTLAFTTFQTDCDDLDVKSGDADRTADQQVALALRAATGLYEVTGKAEYADFVAARHASVPPMSYPWWGPYDTPVQNGLLRHASQPGVSASLAATIRNQKASQNGVMSIDQLAADLDLYRAYMPDEQYHWGSNLVRGHVGNLNLDFVEFGINAAQAAAYREVAEQHLHWLHGANPLRTVMLSAANPLGAEASIDEIYHAWFDDGTIYDNAQTSPRGPAPGYVPGGPNKYYSGTVGGITDQPPQKAFKVWNAGYPEASWELTEPAIYSQAAYVQLLARVMTRPPGSGDTQPPTAPTGLVASAVTATSATLAWSPSTDNIGVVGYDVFRDGNRVATGVAGTTLALGGLTCATSYALTVVATDAAGNTSAASAPLTLTTASCPTVSSVLYADALAADWSDWSWGSSRDFANPSPVKVGSLSLRVNYEPWGGLSLHAAQPLALAPTVSLRMWVYSPVAARILVSAQSADNVPAPAAVAVTLRAGRWTSVVVSRAQLGNPAQVVRVNVQLDGGIAASLVFDQIRFAAR